MALLRLVTPTLLTARDKSYICVIGEGGLTDNKQEGDKKTPLGQFELRECWYRADKISRPNTVLPLHIITPTDGWCDDPTDSLYNRHVRLPYPASHETLWRDDGLYDVLVTLGVNDDPVIAGKGSAIFLHCASADFTPTLGCIAVARADLIEILGNITLPAQVITYPD